ncbi:glycoside hydrolase family 15 protein [Georgenia sp. H159]|uniref:glycoside hydrolase family 15 protein n=1 Tax=Georgenia sp. H159 TaxID=3076115 RepID=UPI002D7892B5|nr:glycoside hydrolase family 15 protein [Georgenia sp. H159]
MTRALLATLTTAALAVGAAAGVPTPGPTDRTATAEPATYEAQAVHSHANFSIRADGHAGAQSFVTDDDELHTVGAWVVSQSASGQVTASVRTELEDPTTEIASAVVDIGARGGTGLGWLEFDLDGVAVVPGEEYVLVLQAHGTDGAVQWWGSRSAVEGALPSWNHDRDHWGGWVEYGRGAAARFADWHLAFYVNDARGVSSCAADNTCWREVTPAQLGVQPAGILGTPGRPYALSGFETVGARFVPGSSVLELASGRLLHLPAGAERPVVVGADDPGAAAQVEESRRWLASGRVPGRTQDEREMAARALLDLRLLLQDNGSVAAAWHSIWRYSWPRDSAFTAVAFARAGFLEEAYRILRFTAGTQRADGTWEARTLLDGSGPPDSRPWQLDANGWFPWATWQYLQVAPDEQRAAALDELYPTVRAAADFAAASLDENGLPPARPDYWESSYPATNLGTVAPLLAGLRSAGAIAEAAGEDDDAARWFSAAAHLQRGIDMSFGSIGYQRTVVRGSGKDSAVAWLAPPFNPADRGVRTELDITWDALVQDTGGVQPGERWGDAMTWTPETMFFALAWANGGQEARATALVDWLDEHRTEVGAFPEKVDPAGQPAAVATLGWTASLTVLTLASVDEPMPVPPRGPTVDDGGAGEDAATVGAAGGAPPPAGTLSPEGTWFALAGLLALGAAVLGALRRRRAG